MGRRLLVGLIGANIQGSLSPAMHEHAFAAAGIAGHYHLMDLDLLPGRRLHQILAAAGTAGFAGVNITFPCKQAALELVHEVSPQARQVGAINAITFDGDGRMTGYNTDRIGFHRSFDETLGRAAVEGRTVLLVGAGGAGRAAAFALLDVGAGCLLVHDVDGARAQALVASLTTSFGRSRAGVASDPGAALGKAVGVVNATPIGMLGFPGNPVPIEPIEARHWLMDLIYTPLETELVLSARAKGARAVGGAGMCVHQATESFRLFTGVAPDVAGMRRAFSAGAAARDRALPAGR